LSSGTGEAIFDSSELEEFLGDGGSVSPIASSDGDQVQLGINESTLDGNLDFLGDFNTKSDVTILITDSNDSLESGSLSGLGLFLDGDNLHDLIGEFFLGLAKELVNDL